MREREREREKRESIGIYRHTQHGMGECKDGERDSLMFCIRSEERKRERERRVNLGHSHERQRKIRCTPER